MNQVQAKPSSPSLPKLTRPQTSPHHAVRGLQRSSRYATASQPDTGLNKHQNDALYHARKILRKFYKKHRSPALEAAVTRRELKHINFHDVPELSGRAFDAGVPEAEQVTLQREVKMLGLDPKTESEALYLLLGRADGLSDEEIAQLQMKD